MQEQQFLAHYEAEDLHWWFRARRKIIADLVNKIVPNGSLMLDIGCGTGATVAYFADRYRSVGLDASKIAVEIASSRESGEFRFGSSPDDFPKLADQASICLITDVLEHIEQEKDFFADWVRAVQSNTYFLVTVPADPRLWSMHDVSHGHFRRYTTQTWEETWRGLPLQNVMTSYFNAHLYPVIRAIRAITSLRKSSFGKADTDLKLPLAPVNLILEKIFASESAHLSSLLEGKRTQPYPFGVSLISILRKLP